jgi:hypothetical protein
MSRTTPKRSASVRSEITNQDEVKSEAEAKFGMPIIKASDFPDDEELNKNNAFVTGKPVAVLAYHGSPFGERNQFDEKRLGSFTKAESSKMGHFFSGKLETAKTYSGDFDPIYGLKVNQMGWATLTDYQKIIVVGSMIDIYENSTEGKSEEVFKRYPDLSRSDVAMSLEGGSKEQFLKSIIKTDSFKKWVQDYTGYGYDNTPTRPAMYETYLKLQNPYVYNVNYSYREKIFSDVLSKAKAAGHDSVILTNVLDDLGENKGINDNVFFVFKGKEGNIKSTSKVTKDDNGNPIPLRRRFDTSIKDIRY